VKGGTPAIENRLMERRSTELGAKLKPEKEFMVLLCDIKTLDRTQKTRISVKL
jgi:hypothetical protein